MAHILMLLSNAFRPDPRVQREAETLSEHGHRITVIAWDRESEFAALEAINGFTVERIQNVKSAYGRGIRQLFSLPRFWIAAVRRARILKPDAIHCHDLDTLLAGCWLKNTSPTRLVYDAHEDYPSMMSLYLPGVFVGLLAWLERLLLGCVDQVIAASSQYADKLNRRGYTRVEVIGNFHTGDAYEKIAPEEIRLKREQLAIPKDDLVVAYIGSFSRNRLLLPLIEAAQDMKNTRVLLMGDGHQHSSVEVAVQGSDHIHYLGWVDSNQIPLYTCLADVIYYCLKPDYPGARYNAPNALSNAMSAGKPLIANEIGDLGKIVRQTGCGILLDVVTPATIRAAIESLRDPNLRQKLGERGKAAAQSQYNWRIAGEKLAEQYQRLFTTPSR
jgi:glycosyltransferase involved in cell wall biosynthesis